MILNTIVIVIIVCVSLLLIYDVYLLGKIKGINEAMEIYDDYYNEVLKNYEDYRKRVLEILDEERE